MRDSLVPPEVGMTEIHKVCNDLRTLAIRSAKTKATIDVYQDGTVKVSVVDSDGFAFSTVTASVLDGSLDEWFGKMMDGTERDGKRG